jgi:hypothetical protein
MLRRQRPSSGPGGFLVLYIHNKGKGEGKQYRAGKKKNWRIKAGYIIILTLSDFDAISNYRAGSVS